MAKWQSGAAESLIEITRPRNVRFYVDRYHIWCEYLYMYIYIFFFNAWKCVHLCLHWCIGKADCGAAYISHIFF